MTVAIMDMILCDSSVTDTKIPAQLESFHPSSIYQPMHVFVAEISFPSALIQPAAIKYFWASALSYIYLYNHCLPLAIHANS